MKYTAPEILNTVNALLVIRGSKGMSGTDSQNPNDHRLTAAAYESDE